MTTNDTILMDAAPAALLEFEGQPRTVRRDEEFRELVADVGQNGIRTRLICRQREDRRYEVLAGHRRRAAAMEAGLLRVPIEVREMSDREALIFVAAENFGRENLRPSEEVAACAMLHERGGMDEAAIARCLGHAVDWVQMRLALPGLGEVVMTALDQGQMPLKVASDLLRVEPEQRDEAVQLVLDRAFAGEVISSAHAARLLDETFLRPARLQAEWEKRVRPLVEQYGALVAVVPVADRADYVEPWGGLVKGWVNADDDLPTEEVTPEWSGLKWRDLAVDFQSPMTLVPQIEGEHISGLLLLCHEKTLRELAAARVESGKGRVFLKASQVRDKRKVRDERGKSAGTNDEGEDVTERERGETFRITHDGEEVADRVEGHEAVLMKVLEGLTKGVSRVVVTREVGDE